MSAYVEEALLFGPYTLHRSRRVLLREARPVRLDGRTLDLLIALVERAGEAVGKRELLSYVWSNEAVDATTLHAHIAALRGVLADDSAGGCRIVDVGIVGYRFDSEVRQSRHDMPIVARPAHNIPVALGHIVGRDNDVAAVVEQLQKERFVCIAGSAGIGKTRVAQEVAVRMLPLYADGARWVDLAPVRDLRGLATALGATLDAIVPLQGAIASLVAILSQCSVLLVFDGWHRLAGSTNELIAALLEAAPGVHILVTATHPSAIDRRSVHRLAALAVPPVAMRLMVAEAMSFAAVQLFVEHADANRGGLAMADADMLRVCKTCRTLRGLPLALQLAAARLHGLGASGLADAIDGSLRASVPVGPRTPADHRTLMSVLEWTRRELSDQDRAVLRRVAVFIGPFTLESALAVAVDDVLDAQAVGEGVGRLLDTSLLSIETRPTGIMYRLHATLRASAMDELARSGELASVRAMHVHHLCEILDPDRFQERAGSRAEWLDVCGALIDDVRSALAWSLVDHADVQAGLRLTAAAIPLGHHLSLIEEFCELVDRARRMAGLLQPPDPLLEMRLHVAYSALVAQSIGADSTMGEAVERALVLSDDPAIGRFKSEALNAVTSHAFMTANYSRATDSAQAAFTFARLQRDAAGVLNAERFLAQARHFAGQHGQARILAERVLAHPTRLNRLSSMRPVPVDRRVSMRIVLSRLHWIQGRIEQAVEMVQECLELARNDVGYGLCQALALVGCPLALWTGDTASARTLVDQLKDHATRCNLGYWRRWGDHFDLTLAAGPVSVGFDKPARYSAKLLTAVTDDKLRDMLLTVGGMAADDRSIDRADRGHCGWCAAEIYRVRGEWHLDQGGVDLARARSFMNRASETAREQGALSWELRASTSLAKLMALEGHPAAARHQLEITYAKFRDGFGSADLVAATAMIAQLGSLAP